ncbi:multimeric flavodoxin WrbA [Desulfosporosinus orientis DSM 765]|uniref:Multimeric flavodoxin WrbA n=1 Tax=Desulfosporosinus orientis (strain ATCC 19365 / DSM 765 / NCIMB 8382 / VKM B-1628 / Singapore I) TaxID=768706 RepID=G7W5R0_DESOD|nr:flavodoxin family protein [Desulfosporosinus orientis]AET66998.1 multimeric flavodoxin WrbA [Desulfosporosinus orientis DSM 765]
MNVMIITSSPNIDGLTANCGKKAQAGAEEAGAKVVVVNLNHHQIGNCHACGNGWGPCRNEHHCQVNDDFQKLHLSMDSMDAFVLITPVYWGEMSESAKAFTDRLRRCEALKKKRNFLEEKPVISIAAAGGSGNGITSCLTSMERLFTHVKAEKFDFIGVTQKNKNYKLTTIHEAVKEMVSKRKTK